MKWRKNNIKFWHGSIDRLKFRLQKEYFNSVFKTKSRYENSWFKEMEWDCWWTVVSDTAKTKKYKFYTDWTDETETCAAICSAHTHLRQVMTFQTNFEILHQSNYLWPDDVHIISIHSLPRLFSFSFRCSTLLLLFCIHIWFANEPPKIIGKNNEEKNHSKGFFLTVCRRCVSVFDGNNNSKTKQFQHTFAHSHIHKLTHKWDLNIARACVNSMQFQNVSFLFVDFVCETKKVKKKFSINLKMEFHMEWMNRPNVRVVSEWKREENTIQNVLICDLKPSSKPI